MPASLIQAKFRGVRSYSPYQHKAQTIDFLPLTLIVGANGSGKTTIIEALKFIISGDEPPLSDCRRNFIHTSKNSNTSIDKNIAFASIDLIFRNFRDEVTHAKREISRPTGNVKTPQVASSFRVGNGPWNHLNQQSDWTKTMPKLFSLPNLALLNYVILCHQEDNLWCMGDNSSVKQIFDRIFGCEQYKKEIKHIEAEIKSCKSDYAIADRELVYTKERVDYMKELKKQSANLKSEIEMIISETTTLDDSIKRIGHEKSDIQSEISTYEKKEQELELCRIRIIELEERETAASDSIRKRFKNESQLSDSQLEVKMDEHVKFVEETKVKMKEFGLSETNLTKELEAIENEKDKIQRTINKLQVIQLKSLDSKNSLNNELESLKKEYDIEGIDINDLKASFDALSSYEYSLRQNKCEQSETEESLATKQVRLNREINSLEGTHQGLVEIIKNKELFIKKLNEQLAQADPLAKDVEKIQRNMTRMQDITNKMSRSSHVSKLIDVINETEEVVVGVVKRVKNESIIKLNNQIASEELEMNINKGDIIKVRDKKQQLSFEQKKIEEELMMVRAATKEAHNKLVSFSSKKKNISGSYENYKTELKFLEREHLEDRLAESKSLVSRYDDIRLKLVNTQNESAKLTALYTASFDIYESFQANKILRDIREKIKQQKKTELKLKADVCEDEFSFQLKDKLKELEKEELKLRDRRSMLAGSKVRIEGELYRIGLDLDKSNDIMYKHADNLGKVVCNKTILEDLEKLKDCFNHSLLAFHNQMIAKINQVLKSRWRQIYKGGDIDSIELVDEEITKAKGQKGYNYYIAMTKGGIRMKMREKASAGQKALACIIIRMALAELFVKDFAIIALDEPTANLDTANVESLAKAIGNYVKRRAKRGFNIQWVIITHDEQFLEALDAESSPHYYRVTLDNDGCSRIQRSFHDATYESQSNTNGSNKTVD